MEKLPVKIKNDIVSLEYPIFSLSKNKSLLIREYVHSTSNKRIKIIPSAFGAATIFDKELILFCGYKILSLERNGYPFSDKITIDTYEFLNFTGRSTGNNSYKQFHDTLRRLKGTILETNIENGGIQYIHGFSLIQEYKILKSGKNSILRVEVILSQWIYNAYLTKEILTLSPEYFQISKPLERRIYELARKHCGKKAIWKCQLSIIKDKCASTQSDRHFRAEIRKIIKNNNLPDYKIALDTHRNHVVFITRNTKLLSHELIKSKILDWYGNLEK